MIISIGLGRSALFTVALVGLTWLLFVACSSGEGPASQSGEGSASQTVTNIPCDTGLASDSNDPMKYAKAIELCQTTTASGSGPGVISAALTLGDGTGTPATVSHSIRSAFGTNNAPRGGAALVVLSTGVAAAPGQSNPSFASLVPSSDGSSGTDSSLSSAAPSDFLSANGGTFPNAPGCPAPSSTTAYDPVMLTLKIRVPSDAHSFSFWAKFLSSEFPQDLCTAYNDFFVALLDSRYGGAIPNPPDKNLAVYISPTKSLIPMGVNLAFNNSGLFTSCFNGHTGCTGGVAGTISTCAGASGLVGTGMDTAAPNYCDANSIVGGGTDWLVIRGNVVPSEVVTLRFALWDTSDGKGDTDVLLDDFAWSPNIVTPGASPQ